MSSRRRRIPKYRHYRPKNLAVVRIDGHDHYLGKHDSASSWEQYHRLIAEWLHNGHHLTANSPNGGHGGNEGVSVNEVILQFWRFAVEYYRKNDRPTGEADIGDGLQWGFRNHEVGPLWAAFAYFGGPIVLDALVDAFRIVWRAGDSVTLSSHLQPGMGIESPSLTAKVFDRFSA